MRALPVDGPVSPRLFEIDRELRWPLENYLSFAYGL